MGSLVIRDIVQTRTWIDPANPNPQVPDWDFNFTYPITLFDAVLSDYGPNPYTLRHAIKVLEDAITQRQPMIAAGSSNDVITWTEVPGKLGKLPVTRSFQADPSLRSRDRLVTELTIGAYIDTMTPLLMFNRHIADVKPDQLSIHIDDNERIYWNSMTPIGQFHAHSHELTIHTSAEEKARWDAKLSSEDFKAHLDDFTNPHRITASQINTFTREEILQLIADSQPKFFNYKNIAWDMINGTFKLELFQAKNWDPNYVLDHRYNQNYWSNPTGVMPDGTEFTVDQATLRFLPDLVAGQRYFALVAKLPPSVDVRHGEVLIYFKDETSPWVEVNSEIVNNGDLFITYPDRRLYLWVGGQFVELMTSSILTGDQNVGTPDHDTKDNLIASQFRITAGTEKVTFNGETHTVKVEFENDMITVGRAGSITVYYDGGYSPPIKAGKYKITVTTTGGTAFNPVLVPLEIGTLTILPKQVSCEIQISDKVYDGTNDVSYLTPPVLVGTVPSDSVGVKPGIAQFISPNVGNDIPVTVSGLEIIGSAAGNYELMPPENLVASISRRILAIKNLAATDRGYNRTNIVQLTGGQLMNVVPADIGSVIPVIPPIGTLASPDAGFHIPVIIDEITLIGIASTNYLLVQPVDITTTISVLRVKIDGLAVSNKVYDGTTAAQITGTPVIAGQLGDDDITVIQGLATFVSRNVGQKTAIFTGYTLSGASANNYLLVNQPAAVIATISSHQLTIANVTAVDRPYDGSCTISLAGGELVGVMPMDSPTVNLGTGTTLTPKAGFIKAVSASIELVGPEASNYTLSQPTDITVNITRRIIQVTGVRATDRAYDGTFMVELTGGNLIGVVGADRVYHTVGRGTVNSAEPANAKPVITSIKIGGVDADNYSLEQPTGITVNIRA